MSSGAYSVLLHVCCAPCAIFPLAELKNKGHRIAGFFYNPNIHPCSEHEKRKEEAEKYFKESGLNLISGDYDMDRYFQFVTYNETRDKRCPICWWMRLECAAKFAKENGFDAFTTTLLGSPYQDHGLLKEIGEDIAGKAGVKFHYQDFRAGFRDSMETAKSKGIYRQNYCGCIFSEKERIERKQSDKAGVIRK